MTIPDDILDPKQYWKNLRDRTFACFDRSCAYCGVRPAQLTIDHVIPRSKGGADDPSNWVACCSSCNRSKDAQEMETWYRSRVFFSELRLAKIRATLNDESAV